MPEYVGDSSNQACWLIWGIRGCSLFLSDFSGGDVLIAACDSGEFKKWVDFKKWIIIDALNGKHAIKRMNASAEIEYASEFEDVYCGDAISVKGRKKVV